MVNSSMNINSMKRLINCFYPAPPLLPWNINRIFDKTGKNSFFFDSYLLAYLTIPHSFFCFINHVMPLVFFYTPWKHYKNHWFSYVFKGYRKSPVAWNQLTLYQRNINSNFRQLVNLKKHMEMFFWYSEVCLIQNLHEV